jgi:hypothetical protein
MAKNYVNIISDVPLLKSDFYKIPSEYISCYEKEGICDDGAQEMLFYITQFGGFRTKTFPQHYEKFLQQWTIMKKKRGLYQFKANNEYFSKFKDINLKTIKKEMVQKTLCAYQLRENGFSENEIEESKIFLNEINDFYSKVNLRVQ